MLSTQFHIFVENTVRQSQRCKGMLLFSESCLSPEETSHMQEQTQRLARRALRKGTTKSLLHYLCNHGQGFLFFFKHHYWGIIYIQLPIVNKGFNKIIFSEFIELCKYHFSSILEHFHHPQKFPYDHFQSILIFTAAPDEHWPVFCFYRFASLEISYTWNHTISAHFNMTSFSWHNVFELHPHCSMY